MKVISFPAAPLQNTEWVPVPPEKIIAGSPQAVYKILYTSRSEEFSAGIYECTPGKWKVSYPEDEFCTLLEGHVRITNDSGAAQEFKAPDSFLIPSGFSGTWEPLCKVRKFFVIYEAAQK